MSDALKVTLMALLAMAVSAFFFFLAAASVARGYVVAGRAKSVVVAYADSPVMFSLLVGAMIAFAVFVFAGVVAFVFAPKEKRKRLLSYSNAQIFGVRASVRWLLGLFVALLGALVVMAVLRASNGAT